eukprot:14463698-Heterocapsa_arctica.AAC.1
MAMASMAAVSESTLQIHLRRPTGLATPTTLIPGARASTSSSSSPRRPSPTRLLRDADNGS